MKENSLSQIDTPETEDKFTAAAQVDSRRSFLPYDLAARMREWFNEAFPVDSLRRRFTKGAIWSFIGVGVSQGFNLLALIVAARILGQTRFGEFGMIQSTIGMFGVFAGMGIGTTATKHVAEFLSTNPTRAGRIIGTTQMVGLISGGVIAAVVFLFSSYLTSHVMNAPHLLLELRLACSLLFLNVLFGVNVAALAGFEAFRTTAKVYFYSGGLTFLLLIGGTYLWGLPGAIGGIVVATMCAAIISYIELHGKARKANVPLSYRDFKADLKLLWTFSLPVFISSVVILPAEWLPYTVLANHKGGYDQIAIFSMAKQWSQLILFIPLAASQVLLPILSSLWGEKQFRQYKRVLAKSIILFASIASLIAIPVAIASPWIVKVYGQGFSQGSIVLIWLCLYSIIYVTNVPIGLAIWSMGAARAGMLLAVAYAIFLLGIFYFFASWDALGLSLTFMLTRLLQTIYLIPIIWWYVKRTSLNEEYTK
jgi:O-antigen/teichoic acid export membrane protein